MKQNICLAFVGLFFLAFTGFIMYEHINTAYYQCDSYDCIYTYNNESCHIEVPNIDYICTHMPCHHTINNNNNNSEIRTTVEKCYMPKGHYTCPTDKCYNTNYIMSTVSLIFIGLIACAFFSFVIYHFGRCCYKCRNNPNYDYNTLHNQDY